MINNQIHQDPALSFMVLDLLDTVLSRSDNPASVGTCFTEEVRKLTGARGVLIIQCLIGRDEAGHRVIGVNPEKMREWADSPVAHSMYELLHPLTEARLWRTEEVFDVADLLKSEGFEGGMFIPLQVGGFRVGALILVGLPDLRLANSVLVLLNALSTIVALVMRNAFLYEKQEQIIFERTDELHKSYELLQLELDERKRTEALLHEKALELEQEIAERQHAQEALSLKNRQLKELNLSLENRVHSSLAQLRQKDQLLIQQNRLAAVGEMLNNIAHQWRQPLNSLGLLLASLKEAWEMGKLDGKYLDKMLTTGNSLLQNMSSTISDFSNFSRPDKERKHFSALDQINTAVSVVITSYRSHGIDITIEPADTCILAGFPNEYSQVLLNLLANAKEAIVSSGHASGSILIRIFKRDGLGCVTVSDTGGGIPEHIMGRIFDPYFSGKESGTGIGLYMSKMIIERSMEGRIQAYNVAEGAEFLIECPLAEKECL